MEHQTSVIPDDDDGVPSAASPPSLGGVHHMTTTSLHTFGQSDGAGDGFTIQIIEVKVEIAISVFLEFEFGNSKWKSILCVIRINT